MQWDLKGNVMIHGMPVSRLFFRTAVALASVALPCAGELRVTGGLADNQVVQRDAHGRADLPLSGTARVSEGQAVEARVLRQHVAPEGLDWRPIARVGGGKWSGEIKGVPTGGPYQVEVRLAGGNDSIAVCDVLVGDLWILGGQSNMQGYGNLAGAQPPSGLVHSFDLADHWVLAEEPLHTTVSAVDRFHWSFHSPDKPPFRYQGERLRNYIATRTKGAGLGLPFAVEMVRRTGVPVGLIPCAHGATRMDLWDPARRDEGGDSLYGSMLRRFRAVGGRVKGLLWYQGESDASPLLAPVFQQKFERFIAAVRTDFGERELPVYYVQLGRMIGSASPAWNLVQEAQRKAELKIPECGMVAAIDTELDDGIHVGTESLKTLGRRLAVLACHDLFLNFRDCARAKRGPRPVSASYRDGVVRVIFSEVNGSLRSAGRLNGFYVQTASGEVWPHLYRQSIDPEDGRVVLLHVAGDPPPGATIGYGYGNDPYCNLTDQMDMAAPVFGPIPLARRGAR